MKVQVIKSFDTAKGVISEGSIVEIPESMNWYSHSGHLEKDDIEKKLFEVRDDNKEKELFKTI